MQRSQKVDKVIRNSLGETTIVELVLTKQMRAEGVIVTTGGYEYFDTQGVCLYKPPTYFMLKLLKFHNVVQTLAFGS